MGREWDTRRMAFASYPTGFDRADSLRGNGTAALRSPPTGPLPSAGPQRTLSTRMRGGQLPMLNIPTEYALATSAARFGTENLRSIALT